MRKGLLVSVDAKGVSKELLAPGDFSSARRKFNAYKLGYLPAGIARVELYEITNATTGRDAKAAKQREDGYLIDLDGTAYPAEVHKARAAWRSADQAARAEAEGKGLVHKPKGELPEKLSDLKPAKV